MKCTDAKLTYHDTDDSRHCAEQNMIIKCVGRETVGLPGERTRVDTDDCQVLDYTAFLAEARFPHVFKDGGCDEKVA